MKFTGCSQLVFRDKSLCPHTFKQDFHWDHLPEDGQDFDSFAALACLSDEFGALGLAPGSAFLTGELRGFVKKYLKKIREVLKKIKIDGKSLLQIMYHNLRSVLH